MHRVSRCLREKSESVPRSLDWTQIDDPASQRFFWLSCWRRHFVFHWTTSCCFLWNDWFVFWLRKLRMISGSPDTAFYHD